MKNKMINETKKICMYLLIPIVYILCKLKIVDTN